MAGLGPTNISGPQAESEVENTDEPDNESTVEPDDRNVTKPNPKVPVEDSKRPHLPEIRKKFLPEEKEETVDSKKRVHPGPGHVGQSKDHGNLNTPESIAHAKANGNSNTPESVGHTKANGNSDTPESDGQSKSNGNSNVPKRDKNCAEKRKKGKTIKKICPCKFSINLEKRFTNIFLLFLWLSILGFALTSRISAHIIIWNLGPLYNYIFENNTTHAVIGAADQHECSLIRHSVWALCIAMLAPCICTAYEARYTFHYLLKESPKCCIVIMIVVLDLLDFGIKTVLVLICLPAFDPYIAAVIYFFINPSVTGLLRICTENKTMICAHLIFGIFGLTAASCIALVIWFERSATFFAISLTFLILASLFTFLWDYFANTKEYITSSSNDNATETKTNGNASEQQPNDDITPPISKLENSGKNNDQKKQKTEIETSEKTENKSSDATMPPQNTERKDQEKNHGCFSVKYLDNLSYLNTTKYYIPAAGFASFFKAIIIIIIGVIFHVIDIKTTVAENCNNIFPYRVAGINIGFSLMCYIFSKTACKILRQRWFFALPLSISVIATPVILYILVHIDVPYFTEIAIEAMPISLNEMELQFQDISNLYGLLAAAFLFGALSFFFTIRHAYNSEGRPPGCNFRLFIKPLYNPFFIEQSLLLNRRRYDSASQEKPSKTDNAQMLYICATMWHEQRKEMLQLIKSILGMDKAHSRKANSNGTKSNDKPINIEVHIIFDDAFDEHGIKLNSYVEELLEILKQCLQETQNEQEKGKNGQDVDNKPVAQDVQGKRKNGQDVDKPVAQDEQGKRKNGQDVDSKPVAQNEQEKRKNGQDVDNKPEAQDKQEEGKNSKDVDSKPVAKETPYGGRLTWILPEKNLLHVHLKDSNRIKKKKRWSQILYMRYIVEHLLLVSKCDLTNTFILALDGDVSFKAKSVKLLLERMQKNEDVGAACGRIHPKGSGPIVWFQRFEYALSHWLQKSTEHVLGCVLCSPGCFSLFRASAIAETIDKYSKKPKRAEEYVRYDQGEDRWYSQILLANGYKIEYCAAADAKTYAPEGFFELFKQRRRWTPSTLGNILAIIMKSKAVRSENQYIKWFYILYQVVLFVTSVLTPGTIFLLILGSIITAFPDIDPLVALIINVIPVSLFTFVCFVFSEETQLYVAGLLSNIYALMMLAVFVGLLQISIEAGLCSVTSVFMIYVASVFFLAAVLHPKEFRNLFYGFVYFLAIPSTSMLMVIYALVNLHVVSWGTRESSRSVETTKKENVFKTFCNFVCCKEYKSQIDVEQGNGENEVSGNTKYKIEFDKQMMHQKVTDHSITVIWKLPEESVLEYSLTAREEETGKSAKDQSKQIDGDKMKAKIKNLKPNTSYIVSLTATFCNKEDIKVVERIAIKTREENYKENTVNFAASEISDSSITVMWTNKENFKKCHLEWRESGSRKIIDGCEITDNIQKKEIKNLYPHTAYMIEITVTTKDNKVHKEHKIVTTIPPKKWLENDKFQKKRESEDKDKAEAEAENEESRYLEKLKEDYLRKEITSVKAEQDEQRRVETKLLILRNKVSVMFFMINIVFVAIIYILTHISAYQGTLSVALWCQSNEVVAQTKLEPISITFILMFGVLLGIQFLSMLGHRISTMIHVLASAKNEENEKNKQTGKNKFTLTVKSTTTTQTEQENDTTKEPEPSTSFQTEPGNDTHATQGPITSVQTQPGNDTHATQEPSTST